MTEEGWVKLVAAADCPPGKGRFVEAGGRELAVFHLTDPERFVVTGNSCPHAGANLAAGEIDGRVVTCPWHQWAFDLDTGRCTTADHVQLRRYECKIADGDVYARLPAS